MAIQAIREAVCYAMVACHSRKHADGHETSPFNLSSRVALRFGRLALERARHAQQIAQDHARLCHSDGSECEDGCQASADPEELARYQEEA